MKKVLFISISIFIICLLVGCKKDESIPPTIVNGQVLEQGTNKPIEGVKVVLMEGTYNGFGSGTYSYYPIDTVLTDKNGKYNYTNLADIGLKIYEIWLFKDKYFDISGTGDTNSIISVQVNKTSNPVTKMFPFAWLTVRVINDKPFNQSDILSLTITNKDWKFYGNNVNSIITEKVRGGRKQDFVWIIQRDLKWGQVFIDSIYCKGHDTTYYQLKY